MFDIGQTSHGSRVHHFTMNTGKPNTDVRTLREAGLLLGGDQKLADFLEIEGWLVSRWLEGLGHPPDTIVLRCTDLIGSRQEAAVAPKEKDEGVRSCL